MVTVLIYSYNRHDYLRRTIEYWALSDLSVIIADGSETPLQCHFPSNITYLHRPQISALDRIVEMAKMVMTPYVVLGADDDFIAFNGIKEMTSFLSKNCDYSSVQGIYTRFSQYSLNSKVKWSWDYQYASRYFFSEETLVLRYTAAMKPTIMHYCYSVMKIDALKKSLELYDGVKETSIATFEFSFIAGLMSDGKYATLPVFYGARQAHVSSWENVLKLNEWVENNSSDGYAKWRLNVCKFFQDNNSLSKEDAESIIDRAIKVYIDGLRSKNYDNKTVLQSKNSFRITIQEKITKRLPERYVGILKSIFRTTRNTWHLYKMFGLDFKRLNLFRRDWFKIKLIILSNPVDRG